MDCDEPPRRGEEALEAGRAAGQERRLKLKHNLSVLTTSREPASQASKRVATTDRRVGNNVYERADDGRALGELEWEDGESERDKVTQPGHPRQRLQGVRAPAHQEHQVQQQDLHIHKS